MSGRTVDSPDVDVIVVGGGVNGTGVARDLSIRGLRVALFEKNDVAFGASGNSSGMIHGGPRYLTRNPEVTYTSCLDSGHIQRVAPHLLFRVPFLVPAYGTGASAWTELLTYDAFFTVYDRYQELKRSKTHLRFTSDEVRRLEPGLVPTAGAVSFDEWGLDGVRLCVANLIDAVERGARAFVHTTVTDFVRGEGGRVEGVRYLDRITRASGELRARFVVNATGAWAPLTTELGGVRTKAARVRPGKGIHVFLDKRLSNFAVVTNAVDGRQVFLLPWQNTSVLGTTDDDFYGDLDDVVATTDEVRYLVEAIAHVFPSVRSARAIGTWGGVRPTLYEWGKLEDKLSREHAIVDHTDEGAPGLFSMVGGKLASYRLFAEEMSDLLAIQLGRPEKCQTHVLFLPGGEDVPSVERLVGEFDIEPLTAERLRFRHGARARQVLETTRDAPERKRIVCPCEPVIDAEVRYAVEREWATNVDDVSRRTRLGLGACGGMRCAVECGRIVAEERGLAPREGIEMAADFVGRSLRRRLPALGPEQARQEALLVAHLEAEIGYRPGEGVSES